MTLDQMKVSKRQFLTADEVAEVLRVKPQSLRIQAREDPRKLGFPTMVVGKRLYIPRTAFIRFIEQEC